MKTIMCEWYTRLGLYHAAKLHINSHLTFHQLFFEIMIGIKDLENAHEMPDVTMEKLTYSEKATKNEKKILHSFDVT